MRYLSVCSGIEAASVAWHPLGWTPVAFSEIEPFPAAVLAHHYPDVPNYGDMTKHKEWPLEPGSIDLLVGGTPCQSFSVAGLRKGISDPRGGLMLTYLEIAQRLRPRWIVWENVPGVLSSGGGRDFGSFLGALGELGYGWAYRVLDAQWVRTQRHPRAVPQRRRRVFVVGCLGDWERAAQVLFERESVQRDSAPRRAPGQGSAADAEAGVGAGVPRCADTVTSKWSKGAEALQQGAQSGGNCIVTSHDVAPCLETTCHDYSSADGFTMVGEVSATIAARFGNSRNNHEECVAQPIWPAEVAPTLNQSARGTGAPGYSNQELFAQGAGCLVPQPVPFTKAKRAQSTTDDETWVDGKVNPTLSLFDQGDTRATTVAVAFAQNQVGEVRTGDVSGTLNTNSNASGRNTPMAAVAFQACGDRDNPSISVSDTAFCLPANAMSDRGQAVAFDWQSGGDSRGLDPKDTAQLQRCQTPAVAFNGYQRTEQQVSWPIGASDGRKVEVGVRQTMTVRRLTPTECSRLQGFPDDWTLIPWRGKPAEQCPDGPRYKALGNSMACNCMAWIGERIAAVEARHA